MNRSAISKAEEGSRHIDVDDLVVFALSLRLTPDRLLMPVTADGGQADVTPLHKVSELAVWLWALGEVPLDRGFDAPQLQIVLDSDRQRRFTQENRPDRPIKHPLGDPVGSNPELMQAIRHLVREARRLGVGIENVQYALYQAHLWSDDRTAPEDGA